MSADNYYFVSKVDDKFHVSHRFASTYYADDNILHGGCPLEQVADPPMPAAEHPTLEAALLDAHRRVEEDAVVEYGVILQPGLV